MWALLIALLVCLGAAGVRHGFTAITAMATTTPGHTWETVARDAGIAPDEIDRIRRSMNSRTELETPYQQEALNAAKRVSWYVFVGIWLSMVAAGAGAWLGAGRTFRIVVATPIHPLIETRAS